MKFIKPEICFKPNSGVITQEFQIQLNNFVPQFLALITNPLYRNSISEVRIEGHTAASEGINRGTYEGGFNLAQERAYNVLLFTIKNNSFNENRSAQELEYLRFLFNATGFSCGRMLNTEGKIMYNHKGKPNYDISRRVEFRIITNSEGLVNEISNLKNK